MVNIQHLVNQLVPALVIAAACVSFLSGCSSATSTVEVFGKVSVAGKPIEDGDIAFSPVKGKGFTSSGKITAGEYRLSGETGLLEGEYSVKVNAYREPAKKNETIGAGLDMPPETTGMTRKEQYLPDRYNTKSKIENFVVEAGKTKIECDFDLK